jgi:hypothetical protein
MSKKIVQVTLLVIIAAVAVGTFLFYHYWFMPHRNVKDEKSILVTAQAIIDAYSSDEKKANALYLDKAIQVSGEVSGVTKNEAGKTVVSLKTSDPMGGVRCTLKEGAGNLTVGDSVSIKGICTGYLLDVTLIDCYPVR